MFRVHFYFTSPEGFLIVELYAGPVILNRWVLNRREMFHEMVSTLNDADRQIYPEGYPETSWSPEMTQAVIKALSS